MPDAGLLSLALGAGLLAAVNPCGFALLPAYLSLLVLGEQPEDRTGALLRALRLTAAMTLGFAGVFALFGLAVAPVAPQLQGDLPWVTLGLGVLLAVLGAYLLTGRTPRLPRFGRRRRAAAPLTGSFGSMLGFGAGYATASLTCTIAPFLAVVVSAFRSGSFSAGIVLFLAYAAGMGLVVGTVAVATALARDTVIRRLRSGGRWVPRASGALLLLAGSYVAYYGWWEVRVLRGDGLDDPVIAVAESVQITLARAVDSLGPLTWLGLLVLLVVVAVLTTRISRRGGGRSPPRRRTGEGRHRAHRLAGAVEGGILERTTGQPRPAPRPRGEPMSKTQSSSSGRAPGRTSGRGGAMGTPGRLPAIAPPSLDQESNWVVSGGGLVGSDDKAGPSSVVRRPRGTVLPGLRRRLARIRRA